MKIVVAQKILKANNEIAAENRAKLDAAGVFGLNVVGSPGAEKPRSWKRCLRGSRGV